MECGGGADREQLRVPLQLLAHVAEAAGVSVADGDQEVRAEEEHHLADVDELVGADVAGRLDDEEERVAVDLELRPLVRADGVLDGQLVQVELASNRVELLCGRLDEPDPGEAAGGGGLRADAGDLPVALEAVPLAVDGAVDDHARILTVYVPPMRTSARAVVIGGGVGGCSILYWLTRLGWDDVVLVERADLTSGSTFHSAGLVGQLRSSLSLTRMMMASVDLYRTIGDEVGLETGWREVGSLRLASSPERMEEIARQAGWAKTFGLPLELISAAEAQTLFPPMTADGVLGAAYLPTDGYIDPSQLTFALAEGARRGGAEIATNTRVTAIPVDKGRVTGVVTDKGEIEADVVVNAGGMFAAELGRLAGVTVPIVPMAHEYLVTRPAEPPARHADDARPVAARLLPP